MSYIITPLMALLLGLSAVLWLRLKAEQREKGRVTQAKKALEEKVKRQAVEIQQKNTEVKNAKVAQQARNIVNHSSAYSIDEQLHAHGYFRDGNDHRVRGVRSDLSESFGHDRDETSNSCSQSDSSGDL